MATPSFISGLQYYDGTTNWIEFAGTSSLSGSVNVISNANRAFILQIQGGSARTVTAASIGGQALSQIGYIAYPSNIWQAVWGRMNPTSGVQTLSVTLSGTTSGNVNVLQFADAGGWRSQTTTAQGTVEDPNHTATNLIAGDLVVSNITKFQGLDATVGTGQTLHFRNWRYDLYNLTSSKVLSSDGSTAFLYYSDISDKYATVIWSLHPVAGGGSNIIWWFRNHLQKRLRERRNQWLLPFPLPT